MTIGELVGWAALGLSVLSGILLAAQMRRLERVERQLRALTVGAGPGADHASLGELISRQGNRLEATRTEVEKLRAAVVSLDRSVARSVQYIGLVRYNPFEDAGGDQSFALALLDRQGDGVVISSLHGRTATRFYAKSVKGGASALSLSNEEAKALKQAMERAPLP